MSHNVNQFNQDLSEELMANRIKVNLNNLMRNNKNENYSGFVNNVVKQLITDPRKNWSPHVNGWYYANMVHGSWYDDLTQDNKDIINQYKEFSPDAVKLLPRAAHEMGHLIKEVDPTQLNIEYETISGRVRNINHATRVMGTSEMSITFKDNRNLDIFRYHKFWYDYIEAYKKGFIDRGDDSNVDEKDSPFIKVPYFNAIWIVLFKPFSYELQGLIKILGIAPTGLPIKDVIGQRSNPQVTTYSINYKAVDTIAVLYGDSEPSGAFFEDFIYDQKRFF